MEKYHPGGCRYNAMPAQMVLNQNLILQNTQKFPSSSPATPSRAATASAPVVDITYNGECEEVLSRAYGNDPEEGYSTMLNAYKNGVISEERMAEALTRILGFKAAKGMHKKSVEELCGMFDTYM